MATPANVTAAATRPARLAPGALAVSIDGSLTRTSLLEVAEARRPVAIADAARERIDTGSATLMRWLYEGRQVYGASSGVGDLRTSDVDVGSWERLQRNIVRSHSCGVGPCLDPAVVRGAMALRLSTFTHGRSSVRSRLADLLAGMLNEQVHPVVPSCGSVGASGDPVLLAHIALVVVGEGQATVADGPVLSGAEALEQAGLAPIALQPREGLALVNGLDVTTSQAALTMARVERALSWAEAASALSLEAMRGCMDPFQDHVQALHGPGAHLSVAARVRMLCEDSELVGTSENLVQDPYCLRCIPQVHGAVADAVEHAGELLDRDVAGVVDNPVAFPETDSVHHCGLFHGQRSALAADSTATGIASLANLIQARVSLLLRGQRGLPRMLCADPGSQSGLMMLETTSGSLVGKLRAQAAPLSVHNVPVSTEQEDHVSMAWEGWRRVDEMASGLADLVAIELLAAATACRWRAPDRPGWAARAMIDLVGDAADPAADDRPLADDLARLADHVLTELPPQ